jgi:hypothetical protein
MMESLEAGDKVLNCNPEAAHSGRIGVVSAVRDNLVWAKYEDEQETNMKSFDYQRIEDIEGDVLFERLTDNIASSMRTFETGATRDTDENKLDFEGFLSPIVIERYAQYMHKHRKQSDGKLRDSDNWQKGIPIEQYMKSLWRHVFSVWKEHRIGKINEDDICAAIFNLMGILHEILKSEKKDKTIEILKEPQE